MADSVILEFPSEYRFLNMVDLLCVELVGEMGLPPEAQNEISISVIEACTNSLEHGNKCCPERNVRVVMTMFPDRFQVEAFDHGEGFDFDEYMKHIPDPADIAHLRGRGIYIMQHMMDELSYERLPDRGIKIALVKYLPGKRPGNA